MELGRITFAPRPWELVLVGEDSPTSHYGVLDSQGSKVALMSSRSEHEQAEANARLITAAPDLLTSLKEMLEVFAAACRLIDDHRLNAELVKAVDAVGIPGDFRVRAQRSIAIAEGREP